MTVDAEAAASILREVAAEAILPRFQSLASHEVMKKGPGDLVTVADHEAEELLTRRLPDLLPGSLVVGEEAVSVDSSVLSRLFGDDPIWIVDPVDGTRNFSKGDPTFGVMVALVRAGQVIGAWIYDPLGDRMAVAMVGDGMTLNGALTRIETPPGPENLRPHGLNLSEMTEERRAAIRQRAVVLGERRRFFCAAHEYLALIDGSLSFTAFHRIQPWDHAPGHLLVREAGGTSLHWDGSDYDPRRPKLSGLLSTPDRSSWARVASVLFAPGLPD